MHPPALSSPSKASSNVVNPRRSSISCNHGLSDSVCGILTHESLILCYMRLAWFSHSYWRLRHARATLSPVEVCVGLPLGLTCLTCGWLKTQPPLTRHGLQLDWIGKKDGFLRESASDGL